MPIWNREATMRIRTIKPEFWEHPVMIRQSDATKLLAIGLLNLADDDGYFYADPKAVRNSIRQNDDDSRIATVSLRDLSEIGYISIRNHATHGPIGKIESFAAHQVINKPKPSKIKALYEYGIDTVLIPDEERLEGNGTEWNKEGKVKEPSPATADESDFFSQPEITPKKETTSPEGLTFAHWFRDTLPEKTNMPDRWEKSFAQVYDDLVRLDGRDGAEIRRVCQWARNDSFWSSNFQSPAKLRKRNKDGIQYYDVFLEKAHQVKRAVQKGTIENIQLKILNGPDKNV